MKTMLLGEILNMNQIVIAVMSFFHVMALRVFFFLKFQNIWSLEDISSSITLVLCMITYFSIILVKFKF